jgi:hypothetical protein
MTAFYSSIYAYIVKLLFLISFLINFVGIRQGQSPLRLGRLGRMSTSLSNQRYQK